MSKNRVISIVRANKKVTDDTFNSSKLDIRSSSEQRYAPLFAEKLEQAVARILHCGEIRESYHSKVVRAERNISDDDIQYGLTLSWTLAEEPNWDEQHGNWEYLICTCDIERDPMHLKIAVDVEHNRLHILTKF